MKDVDEMLRVGLFEEAERARFDASRWDPSVTELPAPRRPRLLGLRPIPRALTGLAAAAVLAAAIAGPLLLLSRLGSDTLRRGPGSDGSSTPTGYIRQADLDDGLSIRIPAGWTFHQDPSGPAEPRTVFAVGSWPFPIGGECAPTAAQEQIPTDGAFFWLIEYGDPQGNDFPQRPERFDLDPATLANYECSVVPSYLIRFQEAGRSFQVHVSFGPEASESVEHEVVRTLEGLEVLPTGQVAFENAVRDCSGPWASCPVAGWLREVVAHERGAGWELQDETESALVVGIGDGNWYLWGTTPEGKGSMKETLEPEGYHLLTVIEDTPLYTDGTRLVWEAQGIWVWMSEGPRYFGGLPGVGVVVTLFRGTKEVPLEAGLP